MFFYFCLDVGSHYLRGRRSERRGTDAKRTVGDAGKAFYTFFLSKHHRPGCTVSKMQSVGRAVNNAVSAMGASVTVPVEAFVLDDNIKFTQKIVSLVNVLLSAGDFQGEIAFFFRGNFGAKDIDGQIKISNKLADNGFFGLAFGKVEVYFFGDHFTGPFISNEFIPWFNGSLWLGSEIRNLPSAISALSKLHIFKALL